MAAPVLIHENRLGEGTLTATSTAAGFDVANLTDWRPFTFWKPTGDGAIVKVDLGITAWEFTAVDDSWTAAGATLTTNPTYINIASTGTDPIFRSPSGLTIDGATERYIVARIRRNAGSGWDGTAFYVNAAHAEGASFIKDIADPTGGTPGSWFLAIWDMHDLTAGGDDWKEGTTSQIRLDFGSTASDDFDVDWVATMTSLAADSCLVWGHDMATAGVTLVARGSNDDFSTSETFSSAAVLTNKPLLLTWTASQYRWYGFNFNAGTPTIAIVAVGTMLALPRGFAPGFDPTHRTPRGRLSTSVAGHPLGRALDFEEWRQTLNVPLVTWAFVRDTWEPAWNANLAHNPFALSWDRTNYPEEIHLVAAAGGYETPHRAGSLADLRVEVTGLAREL